MKKLYKHLVLCIISLLIAAGMFTIIVIYEKIVNANGYVWLYPWMDALIKGICIGSVIIAIAVFIKGKVKFIIIPIIVVASVLPAIYIAVTQSDNLIIKKSPNRQNVLVLKNEDNIITVERVMYHIFAKEKETLPYKTNGNIKYEWVQNDTCAITYEAAEEESTHVYIATFGVRGSVISYIDPLSVIIGNWQGTDENGTEYVLNTSGGNVSLSVDGIESTYNYDDCVRFGTSAVALVNEEHQPEYSVILNEDCIIDEDYMIEDGGTLGLMATTMEDTNCILLKCTDDKSDNSLQNDLTSEYDDYTEELSRIQKMQEYIRDGIDVIQGVIDQGIIYTATASYEPGAFTMNAYKEASEEGRINGVDFYCDVTKVTLVAGDLEDGLYEMNYNGLYVSPGNQGAAPTSEETESIVTMRIMRYNDGYLATIIGYGEYGMDGIEPITPKVYDYSNMDEYHFFLAGEYDTTYMYVSRKTPEECLNLIYEDNLSIEYPEGVLKWYDDMPYIQLDNTGNNVLIYEGMTPDTKSYRYTQALLDIPYGESNEIYKIVNQFTIDF